jgi:hypothetical protein
MILEILFALFFAGVVAELLSWNDVNGWMTTQDAAHVGELVKSRLDNGNYKIVAGVFNAGGVKIATKDWEAVELDDEIKSKFKRFKNRAVVKIKA